MGPTFIKAGQLLSTRPDLLPLEYLVALSRLQDEVESFDSEEAERILAEEPGVRISKAFSRFDSEPIASASLGQVHYAEMRDGRPVAVKIQRPGVRQQVASDLEAYLQQAPVDGFFQADPHPGNLSLTADHRIALLDLGMVARISSGLQEKMARFLMAVSEGDGEEEDRGVPPRNE